MSAILIGVGIILGDEGRRRRANTAGKCKGGFIKRGLILDLLRGE
jgi:hypothetical protein